MNRIIEFPIRRPGLTLVIGLVISVVALVLVSQLRAQTKLSAIFNPDDPTVIALNKTLTSFPVADQLLVMATSNADKNTTDILRNFASRLKRRLNKGEAGQLVKSVRYRTSEQFADFFKQQVVPSALYYLNQNELNKLKKKLSENQ